MKIIQIQFKKYQKILEALNEKFSGKEKMTMSDVLDMAIENATKNADWGELRHFQYRKKNVDGGYDGYFYENIFYKIPYSNYEEIKQYIHDDINVDDIVNFSLLFSKEFIVLKIEKKILDATWDVDRLLLVLDHFFDLDNLKFSEDYVNFDCPACGHRDFRVFLNQEEGKEKPIQISCWSETCDLHRGDLWSLLSYQADDLSTAVNESWDVLKNIDYKKLDTIKEYEGIKINKSYENQNIAKIIADCDEKYNYLYRQGFQKADLLVCDVLHRGNERGSCPESDDFRNRIIYVIRDIEGHPAGLQGRSTEDNDAKRQEYIQEDSSIPKEKWEKLGKKTINSAGFAKGEHLFLLNHYVEKAQKMNIVVVVEGPKDAVRIYGQHFDDIAVVSSLGCELSEKQIELLAKVFGKKKQIVLAYDGDQAGFIGNIKTYQKLCDAGFTDVSFALYPQKTKTSFFKDFGEMNCKQGTKSYVWKTLCGGRGISLKKYIEKMEERGFSLSENEKKIVQEVEEKATKKEREYFADEYKREIIDRLREEEVEVKKAAQKEVSPAEPKPESKKSEWRAKYFQIVHEYCEEQKQKMAAQE